MRKVRTMKTKTLKTLIVTIVFSAIPAFLSYLASSSLIFDKLIQIGFLGETINIPLVQDYCLWIGIAFSAIFLSAKLFCTKQKYSHVLEQRNALIKMNKNILASSLGQRILSNSFAFDIRIFIPKHPFLYKILEKLHIMINKKFIIKNIDLIAEQGTTMGLSFEVFPKQEGLVGACYSTKAMIYDDDLEHTNCEKYQLKQNQIARTSGLKWSICCPIFDESNVVVAVLALDGKTRIKIDKEKEAMLREEILVFSRMLYDSVPMLFKR